MRPSPFHKGSGLSKPAVGPSGLGKPPRPAAKKAAGKKSALDSEEDEGAVLSDDSDVVEEAPKPRAPTARRAAASRAPAKYVEESSEDEVRCVVARRVRWQHRLLCGDSCCFD